MLSHFSFRSWDAGTKKYCVTNVLFPGCLDNTELSFRNHLGEGKSKRTSAKYCSTAQLLTGYAVWFVPKLCVVKSTEVDSSRDTVPCWCSVAKGERYACVLATALGRRVVAMSFAWSTPDTAHTVLSRLEITCGTRTALMGTERGISNGTCACIHN